jgi:hypothetical protein
MIAHDPGRRAGWVRFFGRRLIHVSTSILLPNDGEHVIVEYPEGRGGNTRATPDDLIALAYRAGKYAGRCEERGAIVTCVKPSEWKGGVPKKIHHPRIRKRLSSVELALCEGAPPDIWDAIGLGLWLLDTSSGQG